MAKEYGSDGPIPAILNIDANQISPVLMQVVDAINAGVTGFAGPAGPAGPGYLTGPTGVNFRNFFPPTVSPGVTGQVWSNGGVLNVSLGPGT